MFRISLNRNSIVFNIKWGYLIFHEKIKLQNRLEIGISQHPPELDIADLKLLVNYLFLNQKYRKNRLFLRQNGLLDNLKHPFRASKMVFKASHRRIPFFGGSRGDKFLGGFFWIFLEFFCSGVTI